MMVLKIDWNIPKKEIIQRAIKEAVTHGCHLEGFRFSLPRVPACSVAGSPT
jgi:hypothetical protein